MNVYDAIPTEYNGTQYRSRLEADMARVLSVFRVAYEYEGASYLLANGQHYRPDFYLPALDAVLEVRGYRTEDGDRQIAQFMREVACAMPNRPAFYGAILAGPPVELTVAGSRALHRIFLPSETLERQPYFAVGYGSAAAGWGFCLTGGQWAPYAVSGDGARYIGLTLAQANDVRAFFALAINDGGKLTIRRHGSDIPGVSAMEIRSLSDDAIFAVPGA